MPGPGSPASETVMMQTEDQVTEPQEEHGTSNQAASRFALHPWPRKLISSPTECFIAFLWSSLKPILQLSN